ncbi:vinorine synthase-like [Coffea eugenioides]|uniref:vinorine synthase-like n=1 Tax=Coffea eugenioides TaxID=49369 RepID=UPI000F608E44|nr:vinorine synthase-like [Coffea eugenioides]
MKVDVQVISRCTIKPSSPTPDHLQHYPLSFLDQINPPVFMPLVLFYPSDQNHLITSTPGPGKLNQLKKSLSEALTRFYPLAGRLIDNTYVDCNDEGIPYVEARASCRLSDFLDNPIPGELNKFLPFDLDDVKDIGMVIQVTLFECGGVAVGVAISHKIADATSLFLFVTSWATISRRDSHETRSPIFESAAIFPPRDVAGYNHALGMVKKDEIVTKRLVFTASKIASLREKYTTNSNTATGDEYHQIRPTRIEALSAFIWTRFLTATAGHKDNRDKMYMLNHAVNLRPRMHPPLSECYFGNLSRPAITIPSFDNDEQGYGIVNQVRDAIRNVGGDQYVTKLREGDKHLNFIKERAKLVNKGEVVSFSFTSLCRFPSYEADFGWGKPVWIGSASLTFKNLVVFLDTQSGDGIEAWINMKLEDMAKLEADKELLKYVSTSTDAKT